VQSWIGSVIGVCLLLQGAVAEARRVALLVGISQYRVADIRKLPGAVNDVSAMRRVLTQRWGFADTDIQPLTDAQATRSNILAELDALQKRTGPGDELLIYFSGHGTSALDLDATELPVPHGSGAFMTHDFDPGHPGADGLIIGRTDLVPRLTALEAGGRRLWVVMDSCFSGQGVRQTVPTTQDTSAWPERTLPPSRTQTAARLGAVPAGRPAPPPYPYHATAFLAAAAEGETAKDISGAKLAQWPTLDGQPHGALTDALLRVLDGRLPADLNADGQLDLHEVHRAVADFMAQRPYGHTPQRLPAVADDPQGLGSRPVLSARGVALTPREAPPTPLAVRADGLPAALLKRLEGLPDVRLGGSGSADLVLSASGGTLDVIDASGDRLLQLPAISTATDIDRLAGQVRQLAWAKRLSQLVERHQRGVLPVDIEPDGYGGNLMVGQKLNFALRPQHAGWLVMVNIAADGRLTPLYPTAPFETIALPASELWRSPPQGVTPPEGKDLQFMLLFDREPAELTAWAKLARYPDDGAQERLQAMLERMIAAESRKFVFGHTEFRTWNPAN
jgi:uncharacterized caspase-like protein